MLLSTGLSAAETWSKSMNENFMGMGGFFWWTGVVENRFDPLKSGRVQVRILGSHTADKGILPTADLPWALVMLPVTSSGISGIGFSPTGLLEGSWVFGYFRDGDIRQDPVVMGSLPGFPSEAANSSKGFYDPNGLYPKYINEPDVNRLAVNDPEKPHPSLATRTAERLTNIQAYNSEWDMPNISYNAIYPYNNVYESASGHVIEIDDTANATRIHIRHKNGSSIEMTDNGDTISITKNNNYIAITGNNKVYIAGSSDITVNGDANIRSAGNIGMLAGGNVDIVAGGNVTITGTRIDLNPDSV